MTTNAKANRSIRWIEAQVAEPVSPNESTGNGFGDIAELSRERIRRAGVKIKEEAGLTGDDLDVGFRTLRIDETNMADVLRTPDETSQAGLTDLEGSIKPGRSGEDLLFQVLVDWGLTLDLPIEREQIDGREVFTVDDGALIACFAETVTLDLVREIARRAPLRAVFRDSAFDTDADRINAEQIFRELSPATDVKTL